MFVYAANDPINSRDSRGTVPDPECAAKVHAACRENCWGCGYDLCVALCEDFGDHWICAEAKRDCAKESADTYAYCVEFLDGLTPDECAATARYQYLKCLAETGGGSN